MLVLGIAFVLLNAEPSPYYLMILESAFKHFLWPGGGGGGEIFDLT